jgi:hypothetical protein
MGHFMRKKTKKDKLEAARSIFQEKKVLLIADLISVFGITSRRSVLRYMKDMDYLVSYSHAGQYYTLRELAQFDAEGFWHYEDIGFSKYGTLLNTITHLVGESESGMTNAELQEDCRLVVKAALIDLVNKKKLRREKKQKVYVYTSANPQKSEKQLGMRDKLQVTQYSVDNATALRILLKAYQLVQGTVSPEQVATALLKEGSKISVDVVRQVFDHYELKKTLDSTSFKP